MTEETVYDGNDNTIELQLEEDGTLLADHSLIQRATLEVLGVTTLDSDTSPALFDLTQTDRLVLKLGSAGLPKGRQWARLTVYTVDNPNGIVWQPDMELRIA